MKKKKIIFNMVLHIFLTKMLNIIYYKVLGNDSLRPSKLSKHLLKMHLEYKNKGTAFFEMRRDALKRAKSDSSGTY